MKMAASVGVGKAGRSALQVIVIGDCLEAGTFCETKRFRSEDRPALDKGTTFGRIPLRGKGRMAVSVTDRRRSSRLHPKEATWTYR